MKDLQAPPKITKKVRVFKDDPFAEYNQPKSEIEELEIKYREAYVAKKKLEDEAKAASKVCDGIKDQIVIATGKKDFENESFKLQNKSRTGSVDWKRFAVEYPEIQLDDFRKETSYYWTINLKIK